jgi:hypothetical protein
MDAPSSPSSSARAATLAWLALVVLSVLSVAVAGVSHQGGSRFVMTVLVAGIAWLKGLMLIRHYLEAHQAGPVFHRIVLGFAALAPLGLALSALREVMGP